MNTAKNLFIGVSFIIGAVVLFVALLYIAAKVVVSKPVSEWATEFVNTTEGVVTDFNNARRAASDAKKAKKVNTETK